MEFGIYEEAPTEANLAKLPYLEFPFDLLIGANSLGEFDELEAKIRKGCKNVGRIAYWPQPTFDEGNWISPFAKSTAIDRIFGEIGERADSKSPLWVLLDIEPPLLNRKRVITGLNDFYSNKRKIEKFLETHSGKGIDIVTAETPSVLIPEYLQKKLGLSFDPDKFGLEQAKMVYTSLGRYLDGIFSEKDIRNCTKKLLERECRQGLERYGNRFSIALGTTAATAFGNEPFLPAEELDEDLKIASSCGVRKAYIYKLGGFDRKHAEVMKRHAER